MAWRTSSSRCLLLAPSALALVIGALPSRVEAAGGAFAVDDAQITALNTCQVESWTSFARNKDFVGNSTPACTVDFIRPVELSAQFQRLRVGNTWGSLVTVQAKTIFAPVETGKVGVGLAGGATFDLIHKHHVASYAYVPATFAVLEDFRINVNAGWLHDGILDLHWLTWGAGFEWNFVKPLTLIAEIFGQTGHRPVQLPSLADPRMQAGLRFTPADAVDIDVIYGRNITGVRTHWITIGLNVRFGG